MNKTNEQQINDIIGAYLQARDAGQNPQVEALIEAHPQFAEALRSYFEGESLLEQFAKEVSDERGSAEDMSAEMTVDTAEIHARETVVPGLAQDTASEFSGQTLGRYQLLRELGRGAMGIVHLAFDSQLQRQVALKIPLQEAIGNSDYLKRFRREAQAAARLQHANICHVHDVGEHDGTPYFTMAFISGVPLSRRIHDDRAMSIREVLLLLLKLAKALEHAHSNGVLHRDLKPGNIMIDEQDQPHITDFGLARTTEPTDESRLTEDGRILGTPAYMAPEQIRGAQQEVGVTSDIYSLGVVMFELLTGCLPFPGQSADVVAQALRDPPPLPSDLRTDVPPEVEELCLRMMMKDPSDRPQSMTDVCTVLRGLLNTDAATSSEPETVVRWRKPGVIWSGIASAACILLLWGLVLYLRRGDLMLKIELTDERMPGEQLSLVLDGQTYQLTGDSFEPIRIRLGPHDFSVTQGSVTVQSPKRFVVNRDSEPVLVISSTGAEVLSDGSQNVSKSGSVRSGEGSRETDFGLPQPFTETARAEGDIWEHPILGRFRWCPPGMFRMGSPEDEPAREDNETPVTVVLSSGFWIAELEVTQRIFHRLMASRPWQMLDGIPDSDDDAACGISWHEATELCRRLTESERTAGHIPDDVAFSLPTEAQWEYACRGGTKTAFGFGDDPAQYGDYAWWENNAMNAGEPFPHHGGLKKPNAWGLCDMHGNVYEWCLDSYTPRYVGGVDPVINSDTEKKVNRGGAWDRDEGSARSANRRWTPSTQHRNNVGMRLVLVKLSVPQQAIDARKLKDEKAIK